MKKLFILFFILVLLFTSCNNPKAPNDNDEEMGYDYYAINMNTDFELDDSLPDSKGEQARVIILIGQSNATGCSLTSYLEKSVSAESYAEYSEGYGNVLINFSLDNGKYSSGGAFVPVDLNCAAGEGCFGPELGMAEVISKAFPEEKIFILKFTMSGYSLNHHWLYGFERASIYNAFNIFANIYLAQLKDKGYNPKVEAICWMQGESDTTNYKASRYFENTTRFVSYLREDLAPYASEKGIYFIDAGISASPYCEPAYPEINEAKKRYSETSEMNIYFPTIEAGLTTLYEPESEPDLGHYDALSELELGRMFGREIIKVLNQ